ncbi:putative Hdr-like menaquinol oxidoreductase cytochrome c subunit [Magnetospirillum sp. LM-5]|uniref:cytochrome c3 family protein n=1 Tax=Magnetospirillum sp. LM-5 TaxID=2681466 RepID=UPI0013812B15|nr:cytochrome c3 family protein [Magnetospirillum sp. LM-5]CAA7624902.1 putative Hdr-like menaquinol oxidoreductase cytochrome c subunit [Magnetospirillum sp. LM-5]
MRAWVLSLLMGLVWLTGQAWAGDISPVIPKAQGACVDEPQAMRRHHFDFLKHQRDDTLRSGIRGAKYSLKECVSCHALRGHDGKAVPVNAEGQFCQSCHSYAAVSIDCFTCHATVPDKAPKTAGVTQ